MTKHDVPEAVVALVDDVAARLLHADSPRARADITTRALHKADPEVVEYLARLGLRHMLELRESEE